MYVARRGKLRGAIVAAADPCAGRRRHLHGGGAAAALGDAGHGRVHGRRRHAARRTRHRPGRQRGPDHRRRRSAGGCRRAPPASPWPRPCRSPSCGTSTTATRRARTPGGCSSSARRRAGAPRQQVMDPYHATMRSMTLSWRYPVTQTLEITDAAQRVQRSAYPRAYAQHEAMGRSFASALTGQTHGALDCTLRTPDAAGDPAALLAEAGVRVRRHSRHGVRPDPRTGGNG